MKTVLTVDDSLVVRAMVSRHLQPFGCEVLEASNGQEGVEAARAHRPDLILLDVAMPVMDGRQALAEIRRDPALKPIPVIMLTAERGGELVVEVAKHGVTGCIVKPFRKEGFDAEASKVLGPPALPPVDRTAVLVVDASGAVLEAARAALDESMTVLTALSGRDAVAAYAAARPGVVVVDLALPDADGFRTVEQLKALGRTGFVALAVRGDAAQHERACEAGYHAVLDKPFTARDLVEQVHLASAAVATGEELVAALLAEDDGCAVLHLPDPRSTLFVKVRPALQKKLQALAEGGSDKLIVDLAQLAEVNADVAKGLVGVVGDASRAGLRTAVCVPNAQVAERLMQIAETQTRLYASRQAAREALQ